MGEHGDDADRPNGAGYAVDFRRPPLPTRFQPGQSGNPSGRPKGSKNLRTLFHQILNEQVSLREGSEVKKMTKAEAMVRSLIIGALKGDTRSLTTLFRVAEVSGQFDDPNSAVGTVTRIIVTGVPRAGDALLPANSAFNTDDP
jgi:hypothetical protein